MNIMTQFDDFTEIYDEVYKNYQGDLEFYLKEAQNSRGPVLELACGTGRISLPLACLGMKVVGIDASSKMLEIAKEKLADLGKISGNIRFEKALMQNFKLQERFGLVIIPSSSFLHLESLKEQEKSLSLIYQHLKNQGKLILDFFNPDLKRILNSNGELKFLETFINSKGNKVFVWESAKANIFLQKLEIYQIFEELDQEGIIINRNIKSLTLYYIFKNEMRHLLEKCGFKILNLYGDFNYTPFDEKSGRMVWIAEKD